MGLVLIYGRPWPPADASATDARLPEGVAPKAAGAVAVSLLVVAVLPMIGPLLLYWRVMLFYWCGGRYADAGARFGLSGMSSGHLYSLAKVPWLMPKPHYRTGAGLYPLPACRQAPSARTC